MLKERIYKNIDRSESDRVWNYPYRALEESIANALYHRTWEVREPVVIRILPDCIEIINQGGPDRSVKLDELQKGVIRNNRYRNRRIGDFLKELDMTEGRGTGIPIIRREMAKNGSQEPRFETDDNYSYFITTLPIHPAFLSCDDISEGINDGLKQVENKTDSALQLVHDGINDGINDGLKTIVDILSNVSGLNATELALRVEKSIPTVERYIRILRKKDIIEYRGSKKTGGYYLTEKAKNKLK